MDPYQTTTGPNRFIIFLLGLLFGVAATAAFLYLKPRYFNPKGQETSQTGQFQVTPVKTLALSITNPNDGDTTSAATIKIAGSTGTPSIVVINGGKDDMIIDASSTSFSVNYKLTLGENQINVTVYDPKSGDSKTDSRNILYINTPLPSL